MAIGHAAFLCPHHFLWLIDNISPNYLYLCIMKTLYVTDMDGTLLGPDSKLSSRSAAIISELSHQGALVTVATARTPATVVPLISEMHTTLPAIVMTGAAMWCRNSQRYLNVRYLADDTYRALMDKCHKYGINPFRYTLCNGESMQVYHNGPMTEGEQAFVDNRLNLGLKNFNIDTPHGLLPDLPGVVFFFAMGECDRIFALADEIRETIDCSVSAYVDIFGKETGLLELFAPGVSKAAAVKQLARDINADRIVAFGDNLNDIPMMQAADVAVAVGNALDQVKAIATHVIDTNATDAVARFIAADFTSTQ